MKKRNILWLIIGIISIIVFFPNQAKGEIDIKTNLPSYIHDGDPLRGKIQVTTDCTPTVEIIIRNPQNQIKDHLEFTCSEITPDSNIETCTIEFKSKPLYISSPATTETWNYLVIVREIAEICGGADESEVKSHNGTFDITRCADFDPFFPPWVGECYFISTPLPETSITIKVGEKVFVNCNVCRSFTYPYPLSYKINWGDGTTSNHNIPGNPKPTEACENLLFGLAPPCDDCAHSYSLPGIYTVAIEIGYEKDCECCQKIHSYLTVRVVGECDQVCVNPSLPPDIDPDCGCQGGNECCGIGCTANPEDGEKYDPDCENLECICKSDPSKCSCDGYCPPNCTVNDDPDCGCKDGDGCCNTGYPGYCTPENDSDCGEIPPPPTVPTVPGYRNPLEWSSALKFIGYLLKIFLYAGIIIWFIIFLWGILLLMSSGDDEEKRRKAKKTLLWALIGLVIILTGNLIVWLIRNL